MKHFFIILNYNYNSIITTLWQELYLFSLFHDTVYENMLKLYLYILLLTNFYTNFALMNFVQDCSEEVSDT